jgi:hypothetical protein
MFARTRHWALAHCCGEFGEGVFVEQWEQWPSARDPGPRKERSINKKGRARNATEQKN